MIALTRTSLLALDARDVHVLMEREPKIAARVHQMAREHRSQHQIEIAGDMLVEELEEAEGSKDDVTV